MAAQVRLYADEMTGDVFGSIAYGWDLGDGTPISSLTPDGFATMGELIAADAWDFSGVGPGVPTASTTVPIVPEETCNAESCGYNPGGAYPNRTLSREDKNFVDPPNLERTNAVQEWVDRSPTDVTIWLRAGAQREGEEGAFGDGESRFCYADDDGTDRTESPLWRFTHQDGSRWYAAPGDSWLGGPFDCEQSIFNQICGQPSGFFDELYVFSCSDHAGTQSGEILKEGVVTLPSGHILDALLVRTLADFCVAFAQPCSLFKVAEVRTIVYLWMVPRLGTVVRLTSAQEGPADLVSFDTLAETDIKFGLLPPLDIRVDRVTGDSVGLAWDPPLVADFIDGWKVYWDIDSGVDTAYDFDSERNPGQVAFDGASAVVSGLDPQTTYHFTVTALSTYTDPSTQVDTPYESLLFPEQVTGPSTAYPVEVSATTTDGSGCPPVDEMVGLRLRRIDQSVQFCWDPVVDPCADRVRLRSSDAADTDAGFGVMDDGPTAGCRTVPAPAGFFLGTLLGASGDEGPWGHYGR